MWTLASILSHQNYEKPVLCILYNALYVGEGWLGIPDPWSGQKPWWNWYSTLWWISVKPGGPSQSNPLTSPPRAPGIFSDLLGSVQMLEREWDAESNGELPHLFIPSKTAALVPEFAVEDLPSAELHPWFLTPAVNGLPFMMMLMLSV